MSREVYTVKMKYQRLRMQELEMVRSIAEGELEESQVYLNQMGHQIGHIRKDPHWEDVRWRRRTMGPRLR